MKYVFPAAYGVECRLVAIDAALVPIVAGLLTELAEPGRWATHDDYLLAYNAIAETVASMTTNCALQITQSVDRLYMLIDSIYNGTVYVPSGGEPPALPIVPDAPPSGTEDGFRLQMLASQGELPAGFMGLFPRPATYADVVEALRQGSEEDVNILDGVVGALDAADDASDIFNTVRGLITSAGSITLEGATLATIVAASMATSAMLGLQAGQLDSLIASNQAIADALAALRPVGSTDTVTGKLEEVRELLVPEEVP